MKMAATSSRRIRDGRTAATGGARTQGRRAEDGGDGSMRGRGCCSPPASGSMTIRRQRAANGVAAAATTILKKTEMGLGIEGDAAPRSKIDAPRGSAAATEGGGRFET